MKKPNSFIFREDYYKAFCNLPVGQSDDYTQLDFIDALCRYALYGEMPEPGTTQAALIAMIKDSIDKDNKR